MSRRKNRNCVLCGSSRLEGEGEVCGRCRGSAVPELPGRGVLRRLLRIKAMRTADGGVVYHR